MRTIRLRRIKDFMISLKKEAAKAVYNTAKNAFSSAEIPSESEIFAMLEYPPDDSMGDIAFPCFRLSRALHAAPPVIAGKICAELENALPCCISAVTASGGYLNFKISDEYFSKKVLSEITEKGGDYGASDIGKGKTVVLDYSSPNVAKPFHIGHLGTTVIGHSLKLLHNYAGWHCIGINHLGDWGTQFGKLIVAYRKWGSRSAVEAGEIDELVALYVRFHAEAEKDPSLEDAARAEFTKLEHGDEENHALWKWFIEISLREYQKTYDQLGITFDSYKGESFYYDKVSSVVETLREKGLLKVDDGASIVDLSEYKMPPCMILKNDGSSIYPSRDIAAAVYRMDTYRFDKCIYVTSAGQSLHFAQWFKVVELMGYDWYDRLVHVPYGTCSINGAKLATRTGNVVLLKDLFATAIEKARAIIEEKNPAMENKDAVAEAVGVGAMIFYYLSNNRMKDINFVMEDALSFDGNTGPYAQYTYARTCSILAKEGETRLAPVSSLCREERELIKTLSLFPEKVLTAIADYEPSVITRYILDICNYFNRFYQACPINSAPDADMKAFRRALTKCTGEILARALELICMKHPEKI